MIEAAIGPPQSFCAFLNAYFGIVADGVSAS